MMAELLRANLDGHADVAVVGVAGTVEEAVRMARSLEPAVIVMDYSLPDGTGAQAAAIRALDLGCAVIVLCSASERESVEGAILAGAVGYLPKSEPAELLLAAIRRAAAGELLLPPVLVREVARKAKVRWSEGDLRFTPCEQKTVDLACAGLDSGSIGAQLGLSAPEVRIQWQSVMEKLRQSSQTLRGPRG